MKLPTLKKERCKIQGWLRGKKLEEKQSKRIKGRHYQTLILAKGTVYILFVAKGNLALWKMNPTTTLL